MSRLQNIIPFQFIKTGGAEAMSVYIQKISAAEAFPVIDLEDAYLIPFNKEETRKHKERARNITTMSFREIDASSAKAELCIRVNAYGGTEFMHDIEMLAALPVKVKWNSVFLPKAESLSEIEKCGRELKQKEILFSEIIPVIETAEGLKNLAEILSRGRTEQFNKIAFGHCDYNLDIVRFPFAHHDSPVYWKTAERIIEAAYEKEFTYINSPVLELNNDDLMSAVIERLGDLCREEFGQITITSRQSALCSQTSGVSSDIDVTGSERFSSAAEYAEWIIREYEKNIIPGKSFAVTDGKILVSPHEYISAVNYMKDIHN
ncbi:MAG: aldolase/citrate lyase family protein [Ignavibacteriae bacterium]|nr:aldolase/citrate lyase family protein [Ignavibacteriota bacterium]